MVERKCFSKLTQGDAGRTARWRAPPYASAGFSIALFWPAKTSSFAIPCRFVVTPEKNGREIARDPLLGSGRLLVGCTDRSRGEALRTWLATRRAITGRREPWRPAQGAGPAAPGNNTARWA